MGKILLMGRRSAAVEAVRRLGHTPITLDVAARPLQGRRAYGGAVADAVAAARALLEGTRPAAVVAVAEGAVAPAAEVRAFFGLPGLSREVAARCTDKQHMKAAIVAGGVPCARAETVTNGTTAAQLIEALGLPLVLKIPQSSGGRGVHIVETAADVAAQMQPGLLAEALVSGVEMSIETLQVAGAVRFRNRTRYLVPRWANVVPAALAAAELEAVDEVCDRALQALGVTHGISHIELFLSEKGPLFSEIAARPPGGRIMDLIELAYGFDPWEALVRLELGEDAVLPRQPMRFAGAWFLHPGAGQVKHIRGLERAAALPGVWRARSRVGIGAQVEARVGSGQTVGDVIVTGDSHDSCVERLRRARECIEIDLE